MALGVGVSPSTLTRLGKGKRPDVDSFAALVHWLGVPSERFLRPDESKAAGKADVMAVISTHLRAQRDLTPEGAKALEDILRAAYKTLRKQPPRT
jgi:transcriptional regulator with XRE-family HTH domain